MNQPKATRRGGKCRSKGTAGKRDSGTETMEAWALGLADINDGSNTAVDKGGHEAQPGFILQYPSIRG